MNHETTSHASQHAEIERRIIALLEAIAADLHPEFGGGELSPSAYDTAWVAMVRDPLHPGKLAFPNSLEGLLYLQEPDGSFGVPFPYTIVPTLAALLCLQKAPGQNERIERAAARAKSYLESALLRWDVSTHESIAFEILVPQLLRELEGVGVTLAFPQKDALLGHYEKKISLFAPERLYERHSSLSHSLEAFGGRLDFRRLHVQRHANGNYGGSPASTAAALIHGPWDPLAARWLVYLDKRGLAGRPGLLPCTFGIDSFEIGWALHYIQCARFHIRNQCAPELLKKLGQWLERCVTPEGAGWCGVASMSTDGDDTALALAGLRICGAEPRLEPLLRFELDDHFLCMENERGASVSTNAHVLHTLLSLPTVERREMAPRIDKLVRFLARCRRPEGYWTDKWHASPHYATSCSALALAESGHPDAENPLGRAIDWTIESQSALDGGWGALQGSTAEETAYALMTLFSAPTQARSALGRRYEDALTRGAAYLHAHGAMSAEVRAARPNLWIAKELYAPCRVVDAAILSMMLRTAERSPGGSPRPT